MDLTGTSALITGGASGLGRATAARLLRAGVAVVVLDAQPAGPLAQDEDLRGSLVECVGDVRSETDVAAAIAAATALAPLRAVVNCAGVETPGKVVGRSGVMPLEQFARVIEVNLVGTFNVLRLCAAQMLTNEPTDGERGVIINTASIAAYDGQSGQAAYASSKAGIAGMTLPLARDLADKLVRVVAVAPGLFLTPMIERLPASVQTTLAQSVPHPNRLGNPDEYAALVEHILLNPMLNGEVIRIDGALRMSSR